MIRRFSGPEAPLSKDQRPFLPFASLDADRGKIHPRPWDSIGAKESAASSAVEIRSI